MKQDPLDDRIALLEKPPPIVASHEGIPLVLQALREKLIQAEGEVRESAMRYHGDFSKGLRVGFALALKMLDDGIYRAEAFWAEVRLETLRFEAQAHKTRLGHKG